MAGIALVVLLVLGTTFAFVYRSTGAQLEAQIDGAIRDSAIQLRDGLLDRDRIAEHSILATARRYVDSQPYSDSTVLLFVVMPGVGTAANHPELFGGAGTELHETAAAQARENAQGRSLAQPRAGFSTMAGPDAGNLRLYGLRFRVGGHLLYGGAGEALAAVHHAGEVVRHSFELAGVLGLLLALIAAYAIGSRVTGPIRRSAAVAARIDGGDLTPRIHLPAGSSGELQVLAEALNHMLDRLADAFASQREFIADASHELRTPLTVLRGQLDVLAGGGEHEPPSAAEISRVERLMQAEISRLSRLVDDLLLLAQSDREDFLRLADVQLDELVTELWDGLSLIAERNFELGTLERVTVSADPDRLAQALRNLARNAVAHTEAPLGLVRVDVSRRGPQTVRITVSDDGPGIPPQLRERVFERFFRTDRARTRADGGAGLGLAIVQAIAEAHHGSVRVADSAAGGAAFALDLPLAG